jgi:hypothetical protein
VFDRSVDAAAATQALLSRLHNGLAPNQMFMICAAEQIISRGVGGRIRAVSNPGHHCARSWLRSTAVTPGVGCASLTLLTAL